jgi:hypothetical protein
VSDLRWILIYLALFILSGCVQSDTRSTTQATTHTTHAVQGSVVVPVTIADGTVHPVPVAIDITVTSDSATDTSGQSQTKTGIDPALVGAIAAAIAKQVPGLGTLTSLIGALPQPGWSNTTVGGLAATAGGLLLTAGGAYLKSRNDQQAAKDAQAMAAAHKADADEAWDIVGKAAKDKV